MKNCPHCGKKFNFWNFLRWCGTDTLAARPKYGTVHRREHLCTGCGKTYWLEYHHGQLEKAAQKYAWLLIFPVLKGLFTGIFFKLPVTETIGFSSMFFLSALPVFSAFVKYQSAELNERRSEDVDEMVAVENGHPANG